MLRRKGCIVQSAEANIRNVRVLQQPQSQQSLPPAGR